MKNIRMIRDRSVGNGNGASSQYLDLLLIVAALAILVLLATFMPEAAPAAAPAAGSLGQ